MCRSCLLCVCAGLPAGQRPAPHPEGARRWACASAPLLTIHGAASAPPSKPALRGCSFFLLGDQLVQPGSVLCVCAAVCAGPDARVLRPDMPCMMGGHSLDHDTPSECTSGRRGWQCRQTGRRAVLQMPLLHASNCIPGPLEHVPPPFSPANCCCCRRQALHRVQRPLLPPVRSVAAPEPGSSGDTGGTWL